MPHSHIHNPKKRNSLEVHFPALFPYLSGENGISRDRWGRIKGALPGLWIDHDKHNNSGRAVHSVSIFSPVTRRAKSSPVIFEPLLDNHLWRYELISVSIASGRTAAPPQGTAFFHVLSIAPFINSPISARLVSQKPSRAATLLLASLLFAAFILFFFTVVFFLCSFYHFLILSHMLLFIFFLSFHIYIYIHPKPTLAKPKSLR